MWVLRTLGWWLLIGVGVALVFGAFVRAGSGRRKSR